MTPVNVEALSNLLKETNYNRKKADKLIKAFKFGFDLGYNGPKNVKRYAPNLKLFVRNETILWNKVMKEVKEKLFTGPFKEVPFENFIQSPIGLVSKEGGDGTRLIFHLSYPRTGSSVNSETPAELCTMQYPSFDKVIAICLRELQDVNKNSKIFVGKSDMRSAFRNLGLLPSCFPYLVMKAQNPEDGIWYYFIDKCLPFGASISCALFQEFSDAVAFIVRSKIGKDLINYLDDYLFAALTRYICNGQIRMFLDICNQIKFPVSLEKTFWASERLTFLGLLIDTINKLICIPLDKIEKAKLAISKIVNKKKATVLDIQRLCGFLNFLCKAVIPGCTFTCRIYSLTAQKYAAKGSKLKPHHHVKVTAEVKNDLRFWEKFLDHPSAVCRPFSDFQANDGRLIQTSFHTDTSGSELLGCGGWCDNNWFSQQWDANFIRTKKPSIAYLELYALTVGILLWAKRFQNSTIQIQCDNKSVVGMVNNTTSNCHNCMVLIRIIVMETLVHNVRLKVKYLDSVCVPKVTQLFAINEKWLLFKCM